MSVWLRGQDLHLRLEVIEPLAGQSVDLEDAAIDPHTISDNLDELIEQSLENHRLNKVFAGFSDDQQQTIRLFFFREGYTFERDSGEVGTIAGQRQAPLFPRSGEVA